jgi:hypothetical protein
LYEQLSEGGAGNVLAKDFYDLAVFIVEAGDEPLTSAEK